MHICGKIRKGLQNLPLRRTGVKRWEKWKKVKKETGTHLGQNSKEDQKKKKNKTKQNKTKQNKTAVSEKVLIEENRLGLLLIFLMKICQQVIRSLFGLATHISLMVVIYHHNHDNHQSLWYWSIMNIFRLYRVRFCTFTINILQIRLSSFPSMSYPGVLDN